jgi:hypothetical protein
VCSARARSLAASIKPSSALKVMFFIVQTPPQLQYTRV